MTTPAMEAEMYQPFGQPQMPTIMIANWIQSLPSGQFLFPALQQQQQQQQQFYLSVVQQLQQVQVAQQVQWAQLHKSLDREQLATPPQKQEVDPHKQRSSQQQQTNDSNSQDTHTAAPWKSCEYKAFETKFPGAILRYVTRPGGSSLIEIDIWSLVTQTGNYQASDQGNEQNVDPKPGTRNLRGAASITVILPFGYPAVRPVLLPVDRTGLLSRPALQRLGECLKRALNEASTWGGRGAALYAISCAAEELVAMFDPTSTEQCFSDATLLEDEARWMKQRLERQGLAVSRPRPSTEIGDASPSLPINQVALEERLLMSPLSQPPADTSPVFGINFSHMFANTGYDRADSEATLTPPPLQAQANCGQGFARSEFMGGFQKAVPLPPWPLTAASLNALSNTGGVCNSAFTGLDDDVVSTSSSDSSTWENLSSSSDSSTDVGDLRAELQSQLSENIQYQLTMKGLKPRSALSRPAARRRPRQLYPVGAVRR